MICRKWRGQIGLAAKQDRRSADDDDARLDADIVALFADKAEGWEFLTYCRTTTFAWLRELQRCGKLEKAALIDLCNRYGHLLHRIRQAR